MLRKLAIWGVGVIVAGALALSIGFIGLVEVSARSGNPAMQNELGRWYDNGIWLHPKNKQTAAIWYQRSAESNYAKAQYNLGLLFKEQGDYQQAVRWYQRAANQKYAAAQLNLGVLYSEGLGVKKDLKKAIYWIEMGAENGDSIAEYELGRAYMTGRGVRADPIRGAAWIQKSANQDFATAQSYLALLYVKGKGVKEDLSEALRWAKKADANGDERAAETLKAIEGIKQQRGE